MTINKMMQISQERTKKVVLLGYSGSYEDNLSGRQGWKSCHQTQTCNNKKSGRDDQTDPDKIVIVEEVSGASTVVDRQKSFFVAVSFTFVITNAG